MLLKLYKHEDGKIYYWEAWDDESEITIHFGEVGEQGDSMNLKLAEFEPPESAIAREAKEATENGFREVDHEELYEVILQFSVEGMGTPADLEIADQVEEIANDILGWTGNGHCDGNDLVSGHLNVYCYVLEPKLAVKPLLHELQANSLHENVVIAFQDKNESFVVLWPENYAGVFDY